MSNSPITIHGRKPTHYCSECGALWWEQPDSWSLVSLHCGSCCDNAPMGEQIKPLPTTSTAPAKPSSAPTGKE